MNKERKTPWNPSKRATARVKNILPPPCKCRYCNGKVSIITNDAIYNGKQYGEWPWVYLCNDCYAYVGMHPFTNIPLGTLADEPTRKARKECKAPFEALHKAGKITRKEAYKALAIKLGISPEECHFGWFDINMCEKAAIAARELASQ